jgi:hypothetical protein
MGGARPSKQADVTHRVARAIALNPTRGLHNHFGDPQVLQLTRFAELIAQPSA